MLLHLPCELPLTRLLHSLSLLPGSNLEECCCMQAAGSHYSNVIGAQWDEQAGALYLYMLALLSLMLCHIANASPQHILPATLLCSSPLIPPPSNLWQVINHLEKMFVTGDAATLCTELEVAHPAAKMLVMAAKMQEQEVRSFHSCTLPSPPFFFLLPLSPFPLPPSSFLLFPPLLLLPPFSSSPLPVPPTHFPHFPPPRWVMRPTLW
jgi:hypothetical protein